MEISSWHTPFPQDWIIRESDWSMHICGIPDDAKYVAITDVEAMDALMELCKLEGIIPAIESAHAVAYAFKKAKRNDHAEHGYLSVRSWR